MPSRRASIAARPPKPAGPTHRDPDPAVQLSPGAHLAPPSRGAPPSVWVLADQGFVSGTNFASTIAVARVCGEEQLGLYGLGFGGMTLVFALAKALVWSGYTSALPHHGPDRQRELTGGATALLLAAAGVAAVAFAAVAAVLRVTGAAPLFAPLLTCMAIATPLWLVREHGRRLSLARLRVREVTALDAACCSCQVATLAALASSGWLSGATALLVLAAPAPLSIGWMAWRRGEFRFSLPAARRDAAAAWPFVRWLLGGAACVQVGEKSMQWLLPRMHSLTASGQLTAGQQIIQVVNPLMLGASNYFGPSSASSYSSGGLRRLWRHTLGGTLWIVACGSAASAVLVSVGPELALWVFGLPSVSHLLLLSYALGVFSGAALVPIEFASVARSRGRLLFATAVLRLAISGSLGLMLVWWLGPAGVGFGLLVGNALSLALQWGALAREARHA